MPFNSYSFILFFAVVLAVSRSGLGWRWRKLILLLASYLFYAAWNPPFVLLLWVSTLTDWYVAKALGRVERRATRRALLAVSLVVNLGLLGFFKYGGFVLENFVLLAHSIGWSFEPARPDIILPVGISFYTFQTLSYTFDVYRRKMRPWPSFLDYALYVTFFAQLVAGPIVRAVHFLPQCAEPRKASVDRLGWGLTLILLGLFEKVVVADTLLAPVCESIFDTAARPSFLTAWVSAVAFAGQIFCDFAGYSSCAIGIAMCLGFAIADNFRFPYAAVGFRDFWRRWHISLSSWLRDYLYIPLGGNRRGPARTYVNLTATMLLGGLWHGAAWTFVAWGGLHAAYLMAERLLRSRVPDRPLWHRGPVRLPLGLLTFALVCLGWVFFRAHSFRRALGLAGAMLGGAPFHVYCPGAGRGAVLTVAAVMAAMLSLHWLLRDTSLEQAAAKCPWWVRSLLMAAMMIALVALSGEDRAFIYFQF